MKIQRTNIKETEKKYFDAKSIARGLICFKDLEANPELLEQMLEQSKQERKEGKCRPIEEFIAEMEAKYHFNEI